MTIETSAIQSDILAQFSQLAAIADAPATIAANSSTNDIGSSFASALASVNQQQNDAAAQMKAIELGTSDDLTGTILNSQKASLSFSTLVQVRNKVLSGFDDIMTMSL
jgi:flagellar hook-basal body complex protein FliE